MNTNEMIDINEDTKPQGMPPETQIKLALAALDGVQETLKRVLDKLEPKPKIETKPREYGIAWPITLSRQIVEGDRVVRTDTIELNPGDKLQPGDFCIFTFGEEMIIDPGLEGLPETVWKTKTTLKPFRFDSLVIEDDIADAFNIVGVFGGAVNVLPGFPGKGIPATRFAASAKRIMFKSINVMPAISITVHVKCLREAEFKAKVVGEEYVTGGPPVKNLFPSGDGQ